MTALRRRLLEDMQVRKLAPSTQLAYVEHVSRFARHFGRSPVMLGPDEIRAYQVYLTQEQKLAPDALPSTCDRHAKPSGSSLRNHPSPAHDSIPIGAQRGSGFVQPIFSPPARQRPCCHSAASVCAPPH